MLILLVLTLFGPCWTKNIPSNAGRVCAFGDFNNDRNTDIVVQRGKNLTILLQEDKLLNVLEDGVFRNSSTFEVGYDTVDCSLGDFNGDSKLDILVSTRVKDVYKHSIWISDGTNYWEKPLQDLGSQAMAVDIDGDGFNDVFGFYANGSLYCQTFDTSASLSLSCRSSFMGLDKFNPYPGMPHLYVDVIGNDHIADIVLMGKTEDDYLDIQVWRQYKMGWKKSPLQVPSLNDTAYKYVGAPVPSDFDADGKIELLVPICSDEECLHVSEVAIWQNNRMWMKHPLDIGDWTVVKDENSRVIFRVGDFSLDGFPDLLVTVKETVQPVPKVLENQGCTSCERNGSRRFEVKKTAFIQPKDIALGTILMTSFFDLKEDGSLDILVEYRTDGGETMFSFIPCDYKGDTTFLKVQVFTSVCDKRCNPQSTELGSGISWGGTCMSFTMSDGWGGSLQSSACQLPAVTHRSLMAPYVLFGLGRSPNFVDELVVGTPRYTERLTTRQHSLKQIVPNSRLIMMPPRNDAGHWQSRLYVTPSQLILQSLIVIASVCSLLLLVVAFLHYRERQEDRMERQQQSHRFHFDAM